MAPEWEPVTKEMDMEPIEGVEYCNVWINGERSISRWTFLSREEAEAHVKRALWIMVKMGAHIELRWEVWRKDGIYA